jgi:hypothetical protein
MRRAPRTTRATDVEVGLAAVDLGMTPLPARKTRVPGRRAGGAEFVRSRLFDAPEAAFDAAFGTSG